MTILQSTLRFNLYGLRPAEQKEEEKQHPPVMDVWPAAPGLGWNRGGRVFLASDPLAPPDKTQTRLRQITMWDILATLSFSKGEKVATS